MPIAPTQALRLGENAYPKPGPDFLEFDSVIKLLTSPKFGMSQQEAQMYAAQILNYPEAHGRQQIIDEAVETDAKLSQMQQYGQLMMATKKMDPSAGMAQGKRTGGN